MTILNRMIAASAGLLALAAGGAAGADPVIWKATGAHSTVYIVGVVPPSMVGDTKWKSPALEQALGQAQELWFEAPLGLPDPITAIRLVTTLNTQGRLPDGQTLKAQLSPDSQARLVRLAAKSNVSMTKLDAMKPWRADVELALARKEGTLKPGAVEQFMIATAKDAPRRGFDNLEEDLKAVASAPENEQVANFERALKRYDDPTENRRYAQAWAAGDLKWIEHERLDPLRATAPVTYQKLSVERHQKWAARIAQMIQGSRTVVVAVEVTNLVGPQGLPAMLRQRGIAVEGP